MAEISDKSKTNNYTKYCIVSTYLHDPYYTKKQDPQKGNGLTVACQKYHNPQRQSYHSSKKQCIH